MPDTPIIAPIITDDFKVKLLEEKVLALKELMIVVRRGDQKALELQAKEYERRLTDLNHSHEKMLAMHKEYIPREVYDREVKALRDEIRINNDWRIKQEGQGQGKVSIGQYITYAIGIIIFLITIYQLIKK